MSATTQRTATLAALAARGWEVAESLDAGWWVDEIVVLRSSWSPVGRRVFVSFLVDPQHDGPRGPGESVWAVAVSREPPIDQRGAETAGLLLAFGRGWQSRLADFARSVDSLRR
jgi:hypothetical protein